MSDADREHIELGVPRERMPGHVGIIMDGNGRWAAERGRERAEGHSKGADAVRRVVRAGRRVGLSALTLFAFSSQNWDRPPREVFHLMQLLRRYLFEERREILDNGIRLETVGDTDRLPIYVRAPLRELMRASAGNDGMVLCLALSYGGREMITQAVRDVCRDVQSGRISADQIDPERFSNYLPSSAKLPPLDLLIRTSGECRISNFFLWEAAYAELHFTEKLWPDFETEDLLDAIRDYAHRERRFGRTSGQLGGDDGGEEAPDDPESADGHGVFGGPVAAGGEAP